MTLFSFRLLPAIALICALSVTGPVGARAQDQTSENCFSNQSKTVFANKPLLKSVARGVNLPNWEAEDPRYRPTLQTLSKLYDQGLTHIRLPIFHSDFNTNHFSSPEAQAYSSQILAEIKKLTGIGYVVSVDLHPDADFNSLYRTRPNEGYAALESIWRYLASLLAETDPDTVLLELLNEPDTEPAIWQDHVRQLAVQLRRWMPHHTFVVGPHGPMRHESLAGFDPLNDANIIYAIHFYDPFIFTHQGAEWLAEDDPVRLSTDVPFPSIKDDPRIATIIASLQASGHLKAIAEVSRTFEEPWTEKDIENAFRTARLWAERHSVPIIVNEFGVLSHHAPRDDRLYWLGVVTKQAEANCLGWTHWDYSDGFGLVDPDSQRIDEEALNQLLKTVQ